MADRYEISVGPVPGRKAIALCLTTFHETGGATLDVLAYFRSSEHAELFLRVLEILSPEAFKNGD